MLQSETLRGTWVVAYRELLRYVTERSRIVSSLAMPLLLLVVLLAGVGCGIAHAWILSGSGL